MNGRHAIKSGGSTAAAARSRSARQKARAPRGVLM